jgi:transcriptional regulator with XRE-family HTH domain
MRKAKQQMTKLSYEERISSLRSLRVRVSLPLSKVASRLGRTRAWLNQLELRRFEATDEVLNWIEIAIREIARELRTGSARISDLRLAPRCSSRAKETKV